MTVTARLGLRWRRAAHEVYSLLSPRRRRLALALVFLALLVTIAEAGAAILLLALLTRLTQPEAPVTFPLAGDLGERFPGLSQDQILIWFGAFVATFFVVRALLAVGQTYVQNRVAHNAGVELSDRMFAAYLRMPYALYLQRNSAELTRNTLESVTTIVSSAFLPIIGIASETLLVVGITAVLLVKAPVATGLAVAFLGPVVYLLLRIIQPRIAALGRVNQDSYTESLLTLQHGFAGLRDIRVTHREPFFQQLFSRSRLRSAHSKYLRATLSETPRVVVETALVVAIVAFLVVFTLRDSGDDAPFGVLGLLAYAVLRVVPSINRILGFVNSIRFGRAALHDVYSDLATAEFAAHDYAARAAHSVSGEVELGFARTINVENVSYAYPGGAPVLRDVSMTIPHGSVVGIVGPTGGGKSTLLDIVLGLLRPDTGRVTVDDIPIEGHESQWHNLVGVVSQSVFLLDDTLRRNIAFGVSEQAIDDAAVERAIRSAQLSEFLAALPDGLNTRVGDRGTRLSGGQRQRLAIARALYPDPEVLVFDEGTSALDAATEAELIRSLGRAGRTIIMVTHRLATVRHCDVVFMLIDGAVQDRGRFDELLTRSSHFRALAGNDPDGSRPEVEPVT